MNPIVVINDILANKSKAFVYALTEKNFVYGIEDLNILLGNFEGNHERLRKISKLEFSKIIGI